MNKEIMTQERGGKTCERDQQTILTMCGRRGRLYGNQMQIYEQGDNGAD